MCRRALTTAKCDVPIPQLLSQPCCKWRTSCLFDQAIGPIVGLRFQLALENPSVRVAALLPLLVVLAIAVLGNQRQRVAYASVVVERDSLLRSFQRYSRLRAGAIQAGDSLPHSRLVDASGRELTLKTLADKGVRNFYFYRDDCLACQALDTLLDAMPARVREQTAFIQLGYFRQAAAADLRNHYAWVSDTSVRRIVVSVPAFFAIDDDRRVLSTADFTTRQVVGLLGLYGLLDRQKTGSLLSRARSTPVGDDDAPP